MAIALVVLQGCQDITPKTPTTAVKVNQGGLEVQAEGTSVLVGSKGIEVNAGAEKLANSPLDQDRIAAFAINVKSATDPSVRTLSGDSVKCGGDENCQMACPQGNCAVVCEANATCVASCSGGRCAQTCQPGANCTFTCSGGACEQSCEDASCRTTCSGGGCKTKN
ncbi:MAG: hypothetical protein H0U74_03850 [Bradymonadaceae bacterium]|nr:hypothetical protein [Lujinxingiaceae bacterium]